MPLLDTLQDGIARFMPSKHDSIPKPMSGGISGGGHGMVPFDDDVSSFFHGCSVSAIVDTEPTYVTYVLLSPDWMQAEGALVFLFFVPLLWLAWIAVHIPSIPVVCLVTID